MAIDKQQLAERLIKEHFLDEFKDYLADHEIIELHNGDFMDDSGNWHNLKSLLIDEAIGFMEDDLGLVWKDNQWVKPKLPDLDKMIKCVITGKAPW